MIDKQLEAETANYWRFRHDKFQKGKPELLVEIKRSNGQTSNAGSNVKTEDANLKSEVTTLKKRIEAMTKNIDDLTSLVQKVTLSQDKPVKEETDVEVGNKRKKMEMVKLEDIRPDVALSSGMDLDNDATILAEAGELPPPAAKALSTRQSTETSQLSDDDFVDQLFTAFGNDDGGISLGLYGTRAPSYSRREGQCSGPDSHAETFRCFGSSSSGYSRNDCQQAHCLDYRHCLPR